MSSVGEIPRPSRASFKGNLAGGPKALPRAAERPSYGKGAAGARKLSWVLAKIFLWLEALRPSALPFFMLAA